MNTRQHLPAGGIQRLLLDRKGDRSFERLSKDCGGRPGAAALQKMSSNELKGFPDVDTVRGLSRGLNVPVRDVLLACARSVGLDIASDADQVLPIVGGKNLTPEHQDLVLSVARTLLDMEDQLSAQSHRTVSYSTPEHYGLAAREADPNIGHDQLPE